MTSRTFGAHLRVLRKRARLSQRELGIATNYSEGQICRFERGAKPPDLSALIALFIPALDLDDAPEDVAALLERAAQARGETLVGRRIEGGARTALAAPGPAPIPGPHDGLVGREDDVARLLALLARPRARLITLLGPPGVGKTSLALAVAHQAAGRFADGAAFVALAGVSHADAVPDAVAQSLGLASPPGERARDTLPLLLREKRLLLIVDNVEHVIACAPWLADLAAAGPGLRVLATSRLTLRVRGEQQFALAPLALPALSPLPPLSELVRCPSVALFAQCAQAVQPAFALTDQNALAVAALCHRLDGLPLAIEMAAARARLFPPQALLRRLAGAERDPLRWLDAGRPGAHERHRSLQHAVQWSLDLLSEGDQRAFAGLGAFADGFDDEAALAVAECAPDQLQRLADTSLIQVVGVDSTMGSTYRFKLLETLRAFALAMLERRGELDVRRAALLRWAMNLAETAEPHLTQGDQAEWTARLGAERLNLMSALEHAAASGRALDGLRLANALWRYWLNQGAHAEALGWLERLLRALPDAERGADTERARARAWFGIGAMRYRQGDPERGMAAARESERRWAALGDDAGLATTLNLIGVIHADTGAYADAEACHRRVLALRRATGDRWGEATSLSNLGVVARHQAAYARAADYYRAALVIRREMRDRVALALTLSNLGDVLHFQGEYAEAMGCYLESLHLRREAGDRHGVAQVLTNIGVLHLFAGRNDQAETHFLESARMTRDLGDRHAEANAETDLGLVAVARAQPAAALHHFEQALALAEGVRDPALVAMVQANLVEALLMTERSARALDMAQRSLAYYESVGNSIGRAEALEALALCAAHAGDRAMARRRVAEAAALRADGGSPITPLARRSLERFGAA